MSTRPADAYGGETIAVTCENDLPAMLQHAAANKRRVWPLGRGSRLSRVYAEAPQADLQLSLASLDKLYCLDVADQTCEVGVGMSPAALSQELRCHGLELGVDAPQAKEGSLGGLFLSHELNLLHRAYGPARDQVLGARWLLADGTELRTGAHVVKSVAGYDLTRLLLGSEGRLAVCTRLILRLRPRPRALHWRVLPFADWAQLRGSLPTPRHAFQLDAAHGMFLAWPDPLPQQADELPLLSPAQGEAARLALLTAFAAAPRRLAWASLPLASPPEAFDGNSLQAPWTPALAQAVTTTEEDRFLPDAGPEVASRWQELRRALCPAVPAFGPLP